jgi:predicted RNase H-like HicB family nuclease
MKGNLKMSEHNDALLTQAEDLASADYSVAVSVDTLPDGRRIFLLEHPELPGCMAQGRRMDAVLAELKNATIAYIYHLLETGQPVPPPKATQTSTGTFYAPTDHVEVRFSRFHSTGAIRTPDQVLDKVIEPDKRQRTMSFSVIESDVVQHR